MTSQNPTHTPWTLWYHAIEDSNWTKDTYTKVVDIYSVEQFITVFHQFSSFTKGMFFLMRKDIFPQWEDESNIDGGYWSYKIGKNVSLNDDIDSPWNIVEASQNQISFIDNGWRDNNAGIVFSKEYPDNINNVVIITNTPKLDFIKCINEFFKPNPCKIKHSQLFC